jgi:Domain of unknown function (DUF4252)
MKTQMKIAILGLILTLPLAAQQIKLPPAIEKLADRASNVVDVNLDGAMLQLASRFLSDKDPDEARVKKLVAGLKSITVKSFEFDRRGEYEQKDLADLRTQWTGPGWMRVVGVHSKKDGENAEVFLRSDGNQVTGIAILVADPTDLTIVSVIGNMVPEDVRDLQGHFGIPKIDLGKGVLGRGAKDKDKDQENER